MMTRKSLFFSARIFVFLLLAGGVSFLAIPNIAEAQLLPGTTVSQTLPDVEIKWIRIYHVPESALQAKSNGADPYHRQVVDGVWPPAGFTYANTDKGYRTPTTERVQVGVVDGYVPIDESDGSPKGATLIDADNKETTILKRGDILGIAIRVGPVAMVHWGTSLEITWDYGGMKNGPAEGFFTRFTTLTKPLVGMSLLLAATTTAGTSSPYFISIG